MSLPLHFSFAMTVELECESLLSGEEVLKLLRSQPTNLN